MAPFRMVNGQIVDDGGSSDDRDRDRDHDQWGMCRASQKGNHKTNRKNMLAKRMRMDSVGGRVSEGSTLWRKGLRLIQRSRCVLGSSLRS
jgi:hypothetical protein